MAQNVQLLADLLTRAPVIPVLVIQDLAIAQPLANALVQGGLPLLEITLRTDCALEAISLMNQVEGAIVGAGTVLDGDQADAAIKAGAQFMVSPGATDRLLDAVEGVDVPLLPGAGTASEVMALLDRGFRYQKFFPAEASGGAAYLKALASPLPQAKFCPTGSIAAATAPAYLALPNVVCVGASWVAPAKAVDDEDWGQIVELAKQASML